MKRRDFLKTTAAGALAAGVGTNAAFAQDANLRFHQFLPPVAPLPAHAFKPWGERLAAASGGRLNVQHFDAMALGGRPPELLDQARDGVVDIAMSVVGYTPGRFPRTEVFELPFMMKNPIATSLAFQQMIEDDFQDSEYSDFKVLGGWVHGPGLIHTEEPVEKLEDMAGKTLRGPTRIINDLLSELGAEPVGMPLPAIPEALSKGVINGTVIPWEVTPSIRLTELISNHTEFAGEEALYTATIIMVMNRQAYDALPDDLREILDAESGAAMAQAFSQVMLDYDVPGREIAVAAGNNLITLDEAEVARWKAAAQPVIDRWIADMEGKGIDGQALIDRAKALIDEKTKMLAG
ncbi:TRAP transporter substrate-binding protein [Yoonia sediminilitoris]|uniref:Secreted protein n=1 Tax=Yoonia sediminilitoris TaxID=1286148 RepID=A0A2T6KQZ7_9RHOB|nr:TRAP transporter substrate-binding protein [Yoonia sediminilitoris]PUB18980.1 secreted protein [Yoonia sediminilitoris]RCW99148.1 secreted protein [Yoonia sediminilitoris]